MVGLDLKCLRHIELRRPHIPGAVADALLVGVLLSAVHGDPLVVDLDLLARLKVVVDDHLPAPSDQGPADLDRSQPVHVQVGDRVVLEEYR